MMNDNHNNLKRKRMNYEIEVSKHNLRIIEMDANNNTYKRRRINNVVVDAEYGDKTWKILEDAINEIYGQNATSRSYEELYRNTYNMVVHEFGEKLYSGLLSTVTYHLKEYSKCIEASQGGMFLKELNRKWTDHNDALKMIRDILMYWDRTYLSRIRETSIHELGQNLWQAIIIDSPNVGGKLSDTLFGLIHRERNGEIIDRDLMRRTIKMFLDLGPSVYQEAFEKTFIAKSAQFYRFESLSCIVSHDCGYYLKRTEKRLYEEMDRASSYLDRKTGIKINNVVEREMITHHMLTLIHMEDSGLVSMLSANKFEDLGRMYDLFGRVLNGLSTIRDEMTHYLMKIGKLFVTNPVRVKDPVEFVQGLLNIKDNYDEIVQLAFRNDNTFQKSVNSSYEFFINLNSRAPEFISLFLNDKLRTGRDRVREEDFEVAFDKVMIILSYLHEKDLFKAHYEQHFAERLLSGKYITDDAERSLIMKLNTECGHHFTSKLEGMLTDLRTSRDAMQGFYATHGAELGDSPTLFVQVLTTGSWPIQPTATCKLPAEVSSLCEIFRSYYLKDYTGRKLSWQRNMGTADLVATFRKGLKHELNVSTFQMCILILFNDADRYSYKEIQQVTQIPSLNLKSCLQSLACVKGQDVLRKYPMSKDIREGDVFSVNENFTSMLYRINIGTVVAQKESEHEKQETRQKVEQHRKPQINAAIVRIMKLKRVLDHNNLIAEVIKLLQSQFLANPVEIKKCIESLIECDYLERDEADMFTYRYVP